MLDFLGIGAQKAGSTWLYEILRRHPQVAFPAGKEVHFWNAHRARGIDWYRALFENHAPNRKQGEITPAYAILEPSVIRDIHALNPAMRVIFVIRNPLERAWSAALMMLERAEMTIGEASDQWFIDHFRSRGSMQRGDFETSLRNWRSVFEPGQILVLRYESLCRTPLAFANACCRHIGISATFYAESQPDMLSQRVFPGPDQRIRESLLPVLRDIYHPRIRSLATYLGTDLTDWLDS